MSREYTDRGWPGYGDETLSAASLPKIAIFIYIKDTSRLLVAPVRLAP